VKKSQTVRDLMAIVSAVMALLAAASIGSESVQAWPEQALPALLEVITAVLLAVGAVLMLTRKWPSILLVAWLLFLVSMLFEAAPLLIPSLKAAQGIPQGEPAVDHMVAVVLIVPPLLGFLLVLPAWLRARREKAKTQP
jgi:hypothetical protein